MPTITEIKNLSNTAVAAITDTAELAKYTFTSAAFDQLTGTTVTATSAFSADNDNIQVTWTDDNKVVHRSVGGKFVVDTAAKKATISNLLDVSKYSVGLTGGLEIGPTSATAATLNVSLGNMNPRRDWIIDFSDKTNGATGSEINLDNLIQWIKGKTQQTDNPTLPDIKDTGSGTTSKLDPKSFIIVFESFYFNITQKTFDFWVKSKKDQSLTFGDFTIKSVGFRVTNVPVPVTAGDLKPKEVTAGKDAGQ